jgi:sugar phosphate isomerase/epimerase
MEPHDHRSTPLENPAASRATLARRLRAVERALSGTDDVEFEPGTERGVDADELDAMADRLDTVEARLGALSTAVRAIGECLVSRDRARRLDDGTESVRRAVEALADVGDRTDTADGAGTIDRGDACTTDRAAGSGESPAEWLERVAAGGVSPPPVE